MGVIDPADDLIGKRVAGLSESDEHVLLQLDIEFHGCVAQAVETGAPSTL